MIILWTGVSIAINSSPVISFLDRVAIWGVERVFRYSACLIHLKKRKSITKWTMTGGGTYLGLRFRAWSLIIAFSYSPTSTQIFLKKKKQKKNKGIKMRRNSDFWMAINSQSRIWLLLTWAVLWGPFQHETPRSYIITLYLSWGGPAQLPQLPNRVGLAPDRGFCTTWKQIITDYKRLWETFVHTNALPITSSNGQNV